MNVSIFGPLGYEQRVVTMLGSVDPMFRADLRHAKLFGIQP